MIPSLALFLLSLVALAQQAVYYPNAMPWMAPHYYPGNIQDQPAHYAYPLYNGRLGFNPSYDNRERFPFNRPSLHYETESRNRYRPYQNFVAENLTDIGFSLQSDDQAVYSGSGTLNVYPLGSEKELAATPTDPSARIYLGSGVTVGNGATANYLIKTSYVFVTTTGTLCFVTSCIPASLFKADKSNLICVRRKRVADIVGGIADEDDEFAPAQVEKVAPTASLTLGEIEFNSKPAEQDSPSPILLRSSFTDEPQDPTQYASDSERIHRQHERQKRFLFILTTTVTSYSFASFTYTSTLLPADTSTLTCRPSGVALC